MSLFFVFKTTIKTYEQCFIIQYLTIPPPLFNHKTKYLKIVYVKKCQLVFWRIQVSTPSLGKHQSINQPINQSISQLINSVIALVDLLLAHSIIQRVTTNKFGHFDQFQTLAFVQSVNILCKLTKIYLSTVNRYQKKKYKSIFHTFCFNKS